jgi:hypothetical protein
MKALDLESGSTYTISTRNSRPGTGYAGKKQHVVVAKIANNKATVLMATQA